MKIKIQKSIYKATLLVILLAACSLNFLGCLPKSIPSGDDPLKRTEFVLGTSVTISLYDHQSSDLLNKAFNKLRDLEDILSINKSDTLIDTINKNAAIKSVKVDSETLFIITKSLEYSTLSDGSFDITIGPIVKLWNIGFPDARVPSPEEIDAKLNLVDYRQIEIDQSNNAVFLKSKGMLIDLGGIAKGYAADEVVKMLKQNGTRHALVDIGGNVYALGTKPDGSLWKIGIQDPFNPRGRVIGSIALSDKSIVTSGIYERYLEEGGKKYHHILNPDTGYPFENELASVTVITSNSIDGDALSTSVFSKGLEDGLEFVDTLEDVEAIFVTKDKKVYITKNLEDSFALTDDTFKLMK